MSARGRRTAGPVMRAAPGVAVVLFVNVVRSLTAGAALILPRPPVEPRSGTDIEPAESLMTTLTA